MTKRTRRTAKYSCGRRVASTVMYPTLLLVSAMTPAATQVGYSTIVHMGSYADGGYVDISPAIPNLEGCSVTTGHELWISFQSNPDGKVMYATVLAALIAGKRVGFGVSGCSVGGAPVVYRVDVE